ncbi:MAG: metallophosphoesterase [Spirochaetales bacterium]|uniref:Metallophosphoesterase n=1 Tax=Candidatus Thalassospirochaeta sargassi TaxID=3119039 RepID=A0AAJ1IE03_9SPIO|nr:metallophosphoesterase [Spirochaetales bacterium]
MNGHGTGAKEAAAKLEFILKRRGLPEADALQNNLEAAISTMLHENNRPRTRSGKAGSLVRLSPGGYYIIVPDLHGRTGFFNTVMNWKGFSGRTVLTDMEEGFARVICVGDAFHSEIRGKKRWGRAMQEWIGGYKKHRNIDQEMKENLGLLEMIATVKTAFPDNFHFLKGNHENIANEQAEGNFPFRKYAHEGEMVKLWVQMFMGMDVFDTIYKWEKTLPLLAEGPDFLVCHSEPGRVIGRDEVINAYDNSEVIYSLTWTDNDRAESGSAAGTLNNFDKHIPASRIFGGHRAVKGLYSSRQDGRYIQINRPDKWLIAAFTDMQVFNPERDIIRLDEGVQSGKNT